MVDADGEARPRVASYETLIQRTDAPVDTIPLEKEYREKLRALGYVQ